MNKESISYLLTHAHTGLVDTFAATPDDKITWRALDAGRSALDLFSESAQVAGMIARLIESRGADQPSREKFGEMRAERADWTRAEAEAKMTENWAQLQAALEAASEEELAAPVTLQMRSAMTQPLGTWVMMAYRTFISRFAQINYIQTLYGDTDFH